MQLPHIATVYNWRNVKNKSGKYSIHLRITLDRNSKYYKIPIPQKVKPAEWTGREDGWVHAAHPFSFEINAKIQETKKTLHDLIKRHYNLNRPLTFALIFRQLQKKGDSNSFLDYMKAYIADPPEKLEPNTLKKYHTCLQHLTKFRSPVNFNDIDKVLVQEFYKFLQVKLNLGSASIKKYFDAFKKVLKAARRDHFVDVSQTEGLFEDIKLSVKRTVQRIYLEPDEIKRWKALSFPNDKRYLERDRDLFLFQIYTGHYYKDLQIFGKDQLIRDEEYGFFIIGKRDKNGNETIIPLFKFPNALTIIKKWGDESGSPMIFSKDVFIEEQVYNRNLKTIARLAGIQKNMYNKVGRHTNAQLWVRYGAERPIISKMLGHEKEETTRHYFSVNIPEIIEGTKNVDFQKLGI